MSLASVDLPEPLAPAMPTTSPAGTSSVQSVHGPRCAGGVAERDVAQREHGRPIRGHGRAASHASASSTDDGQRGSGRAGARVQERGERRDLGDAHAGGRAVVPRQPREHVTRRPVEDHGPGVEHEDPVGVLGDGLDVVRRHDHGQPVLAAQPADDLEHRGAARRVEVRGRLVHHQHRRSHRHRAGDREALLLAAGQRHRVPCLQADEAHGRQRLADPCRHLRARQREVLEAQRHLVGHRRLAQLGLRVVEHHRDRAGHLADRRRGRVDARRPAPPRSARPGAGGARRR